MSGCIVFDFDGTLVVSNEIKYQSFFNVTHHLLGAAEELTKILADPDAGDRYDIFRCLSLRLKQKYGGSVCAQSLVNRYTAVCENLIAVAPEVPGALAALEMLKAQGYCLVISSATPEKTLKRLVSRRNLDSFFSYVFGAPATKEQHIKGLSSDGVCKLSETVLIGDSDMDRRAAIKVQCNFIGVGQSFDRFVEKPEYFVEDLRDIPSIIKRLGIVE